MTATLEASKSQFDAAGDLFLSGSYIELGISSAGNFGTTQGETPSGYAQAGSQGVGLTYNEAGFGVNSAIPTIDFFTPGTPYEAFAIGYTSGGVSKSGYNYADGDVKQITETSLTNTSSGSSLSAEWVGVLNGTLQVTLDYSFNATDLYFTTKVTLTNISGSALSDVSYDRQVDPDNTEYAGGSYATYNTIVDQQPGSGASEVTAVSASGDPYYEATGSTASLLYYSANPDTKVSDGINFGGTLNPFNTQFTTGAGAAGSTTGLSDTAININYDGSSLAAGASTSFSYYTALTSNVASTVDNIESVPSDLTLAGSSGSVTDDSTPTISGTAPAGDTITIYDGDDTTPIGTTTAGSDGAWTATTTPLSAGPHSLTATATTSGGTVSPLSSPLALTVDITAPSAPTDVALSPASDSGVLGDDLTNVTTPVITGTGTAGDTVNLYDGDSITPVGTATVGDDGTWSITPSAALAAGSHSLTTTETNAAGTASSASIPLVISIDTSVPVALSTPVLSPASDSGVLGDDLTNVTTPVITGTGTAGDTVNLYDGDSITPIGTATVGDDGTWSITPTITLGTGVHDLTTTETNAAGTFSAVSSALALTINTNVPSVPSDLTLTPASDSGVLGDDLTNVTTPVITGTGTAGDTVNLYDGDSTTPVGTATVGDDGTWSITPSAALAAGSHSLTTTETNAAGTASSASIPLVISIDTSVPVALPTPVLSPASDSGVLGDDLTNVTTPVITGTGTAGDTVNLYDGDSITPVGTATVGDDGTWSITPSAALAAGSHSLTTTETNAAGTASSASIPLVISIDTSVPVALSTPVLSPASDSGVLGDDLTNVTTPVITGTGTAGDTVNLYDGDSITPIGTATVGDDGTWSITPSAALAAGSHSLTTTETNAAGTASSASIPLVISIDTSVPVALPTPVLSPASDSGVLGDDLTNVTTPVITGTGTAGDTVNLYDGDSITPIGTATVGDDGTWSITPSAALAAGSHSLTTTETNAAGTASSASIPLVISIDTSVPVALSTPVLSPASDSGVLGDDLTNVTTPVITGTGTAGDTVNLYDGDSITPIGTATVGDDGTWSITPTITLGTGVHDLTTTETNAAGTFSAVSSALALTINTNVPSVPSDLTLTPASDSGVLGDDLTNVTTPVITGTGTAGDTVNLYDGDSTTPIGTATVGDDGTWSITPSAALAAGSHSLTTTETNAAGTASSASIPLVISIDTSVPVALPTPVLSPASDSGVLGDDLTNVTTPVITGTGTAGDTVNLYDGDSITPIGTATVGDDGTWSITPSAALAAGSHSLTTTETNAAGTASSASIPLVISIDTSVPVALSTPVLSPASDSGVLGDDLTNVTTPVITGTGTAGDTVNLYDGDSITPIGTATVGDDGTWSITPSALTDGLHILTAKQTNAANTTSSASTALNLTIDTGTPSKTSDPTLSPASDSGTLGDNLTNVTNPIITGTGIAGDTVTIYSDMAAIGLATVGTDGAWSIVTDPLTGGLHSLTVIQTSPTGESSMASNPLNLTIDTSTPPAPTGVALSATSDSGVVGDGVTDVTTPTFTGTGVAGDTIDLYDGVSTVPIGKATVGSEGTWSITSDALTDRSYSLTATQTNAAGTVSSSSSPLSLTIETTDDTRFNVQDLGLGTIGSFVGSDYSGPVSYLKAQYGYTGADNVVIGAKVPNVFIYSGSGEDALAAVGGSNVLSGGTGSNWLVGATGTDGGKDTFFVNGSGGQGTWDTLLNFHVGDMLTLFGYNATTGTTNWMDKSGSANYQGTTLKATLGDGANTSALVTFAGLSASTASFVTSTGVTGGVDYLAVTRTA